MQNIYNKEDINNLKTHVQKYYATNWRKPIMDFTTTMFYISAVIFCIYKLNYYSSCLIFLLGLLLIRVFMIFHDLNHNSYFPKNNFNINMVSAKCIDVLSMYSALKWKTIHSIHHVKHGNLNLNDDTRTVIISSEYDKLSNKQKQFYDTFRNPIIFFTIGPLYIFWINKVQQFEFFYITKYLTVLYLLFCITNTRVVVSALCAQYIGAMIGTIMFHLQHQVNVGYWKPIDSNDYLSKMNAELQGSSVLQIPTILKYFTYGIEYHNIHHFDSRVPSYNLKQCYDDAIALNYLKNADGNDFIIGYMQMFKSLFHVIYNEKSQRYESSSFFKALKLEA